MRSFLFIIFIFAGVITHAQREVNLQILDLDDGLSQSVVNDLLIDSKGFLWVGTQNGLNRFDGYNFKVFYNNPNDPFSISSDYVTSIAEDANDNLWIGTRTGLNKYESRKQRFIHYGLPSNDIVFPQINVRSLLVDSENFVWILLPDYLVRINPVDEQVRIFAFRKEKSNYQHCNVHGLYESSSGNIWFVSGHKLVMFDKVFESFEYFEFDFNEEATCLQHIFEYNHRMFVASDRNIWEFNADETLTYLQSFDDQIYIFDKSPEHQSVRVVDNNGLYNFDGRRFYIDIEFKPGARNFERFFVSCAVIDGSNNLWIGTSGKGLLKAGIASHKFQTIGFKAGKDQYLTDDQVSSVLVDDKYFWIGTYEYGLNRVNRHTKMVTHYRADESPKVITNDYLYDIQLIGNRFVIATERGIDVIKKYPDGSLEREKHPKLSQFNVHIYEILPFHGHKFFFSFNGQLNCYDLKNKELKSWMFDIEKEGSIANSFSIEKVEDDLIFIGTSHGLFRLDLRNEYWDRFLFERHDTTSISGNDIYALHYDQKGRLWVGTINGLDLINDPFSKDIVFQHFMTEQKYTIYSINSVENSTWVGTGKGLMRFLYADSSINVFHKADGLPCNEFNIGATWEFQNGNLAFGGQGGVVFFHPDSIHLSNFNPEVEVADAVVYSRNGKREIPVYSGATIKLSVSDFLTNIYFTSLDHTSADKLQYRYRVNGSAWIQIGNQHYASFSNLQPGTYDIAINGTNADGIWSSNVAYLTIEVPRPWYSQWYAYVFYTVVFLGVVLFGIETRTRRLRLTNQVLREKEASSKQVSRQKDRLMLLHKNMTESMNYASRIQRALFPTSSTFKRILPYSFVLYRPKDVISGDFYWINKMGSKIFVAAVDCTGHGVPGALMSVIAVELLKKTILQDGYERPAEILLNLDANLHELFTSEEEEEEQEDLGITDGMDMGICMIDRETLILEYAGAVNSLLSSSGNEFYEYKGDRMPVGMASGIEDFQYTNHYIEYSEDDVFYMASDGYADQFGGAKNKKYKQRRFKNFLRSIANHDMDMQQLLLENNFDKWRGPNEQLDDVMVLGFQPKFT